MCSLGNDKTLSIAGASPTSTMLGGASANSGAIGRGARRVAGGTILGGTGTSTPAPSAPGGPPRAPGNYSPFYTVDR